MPPQVPPHPPSPARLSLLLLMALITVRADGPADNRADSVRPVPPPGVELPAEDLARLRQGAAALGSAAEGLRPQLSPALQKRLPDILIFQKAVDWAVRYGEFHQTNQVPLAEAQLAEGWRRLDALAAKRTPWMESPGPVALGYQSRVDGSVQPYGLVLPSGYDRDPARPRRLDVWFHGRGEKLTELAFLAERSTRPGEFTPADALVLHPYGRYCNGSRFAGETDAWEALEDVQDRFAIDPDRLVVRGFSLGGASCWHFALHHASTWAAAAPGAGFSETAEFLRVFQNEELTPSWWEQKLWRLYDATSMALNAGMVPLVAYSGQNDRQIQAAQAMERALAAERMTLTHVLGAGAGHAYTPDAKREINRRMDAAARQGRDPLPRTVRFITHTLRYPSMAWITLGGLEHHWEPARVEASLEAELARIRITLTNTTSFRLEIPSGLGPFDPRSEVRVEINGTSLPAGRMASDKSWSASFHRAGGTWRTGPGPEEPGIRKRHGLQGPIDDAFMEPFLFVRPTGQPLHPKVGEWSRRELDRAVDQWRRHFRGDVRLRDDVAVTDQDRADYNLVLWGDPGSNAEIRRLAGRLPVQWDSQALRRPGREFAADHHVPILIQPNPDHTDRYVVLNSGFTFREYDYLNNARQTPKLPDWAVVDVSTPPDSRRPGAIVEAGFFGEDWQWSPGSPGR